MDVPLTGRKYLLVRREVDRPTFATYVRFHDGSGEVRPDGRVTMFELDQTTWRRHWIDLRNRGYLEVSEALRQGLLSASEIPQ